MGEIDTKPIESVQTSLSLFGEIKGDHHWKNRSTGGSDDEKERELENLLKDLANYKLQLEAKEAAYMQALLELEQAQKLVDGLTNQLKNNELEWERNMDERERTSRQLSSVSLELQAKEAELVALRESERKTLERAGISERDFEVEREMCEELEKRVCERDVEIALAKKGLLTTQEMVEETRREVERVMELENEVLSKTILVDLLVLQLKEVDERLISSKFLQEELETMRRKNSSQEALIEAFKMDAKERKIELKNANELETHLKANVETLSRDLKKARAEKKNEKENENENENEKEKEKEVNLVKNAETLYDFDGFDAMSDNIERLRKELEEASAKVAELRNRAEQATCRAEAAERAKAAIEGQLRKWRDDRQKKRTARREEFESTKIEISTEEKPQPTVHYQPLYKLLNMKFKQ